MIGFKKKAEKLDSDERYFNLDLSEGALLRASVHGGIATITAQGIIFALRIISTMILARILLPQDFGLIGMVTVLTSFIVMFKDMGLATATIQRDKIDNDQISTLFWLNVCISTFLMLLTCIAAPVIAWFYNESVLLNITIILSISLLISGLGIQHIALLRRQLQFHAIAGIEIFATLLGAIIAILAALSGAKYWALVLQDIVLAAIITSGAWLVCKWRPKRIYNMSSVREMVAFGINLSGFNILNYIIRNFDKILIGKYIGAYALGLYIKSYQLLLFPIQQFITPISNVVLPALSRLQERPEEYRRYYTRILNILAFVCVPLTVLLAVLSDEIILIVLGEKWIEASPIFKVLAFAGISQPLTGSAGWLFVSMGKTNKMVRWAAYSAPFYAASFILGLKWGALGVAIGYIISDYIMRLGYLHMAFKNSPINHTDFVKSIYRPLLIGFVMYPVVTCIRSIVQHDHPVAIILQASFGGVIIFITLTMLWPSARAESKNFLRIAKILRNGDSMNGNARRR
jgi:PST family polysaccharide transporter